MPNTINRKLTVNELRKLLQMIYKGYDVPDLIKKTILEVLHIEVENKKRPILLKRDPNIHRNRIQSAIVKIAESGETFGIHPLTVGGFGADFDGDEMNIYVPLSEEAQEEARQKMISVYSSESIGATNYKLSNEMLIGIFTITSMMSDNEPILLRNSIELSSLHPGTRIKYGFNNKTFITTAGRIIFNNILPEQFRFINSPINKKEINKILSQILTTLGEDIFKSVINNLMKLGFEAATKYPKSISLKSLTNLPDILYSLKRELSKEKDILKQQDIINRMETILAEHITKHIPELNDILYSGAAKGISQIRQIMVAKGLFTDTEGKIMDVISRSMVEGYTPTEYFNAASGGRKGVVSRVKLTAKGGYAYRKMIYAAGNVIAGTSKDCETKQFLNLKLTPELFKRLHGRYVQSKYKGEILPISEKMIGSIISLRSPIYCKNYEICKICYGDLLLQNNTRNIGLIAVQEVTSLSEKIMKAFHTGGAITINKYDIIRALKDFNNQDIFIDHNFYQKDNILYSKSECAIELNPELYSKFNKKINETDTSLILPNGHITIIINKLKFIISISEPITIFKYPDNITANKNIFVYKPDQPILSINPLVLTPEAVAGFLDKLVSGGILWNTPEDLYMKFYKYLSIFGDWDSVHLEVILSNILRYKYDPRLPARVKEPYEPVTINIKSLPSAISWPLGLAFENFTKSTTYGLIADKGIVSPIEKILFGESLINTNQNIKR